MSRWMDYQNQSFDTSGSSDKTARMESRSPSQTAADDVDDVDDYGDKSRIRIQELKRALTRRPHWRNKERQLSAAFADNNGVKPGSDMIYTSIAKYIENQRKKAMARDNNHRRGYTQNKGYSNRRALTPDFDAAQERAGNIESNVKDSVLRPWSVAPTANPVNPEWHPGGMSPLLRHSRMPHGRTAHHAKSASLGGVPNETFKREMYQRGKLPEGNYSWSEHPNKQNQSHNHTSLPLDDFTHGLRKSPQTLRHVSRDGKLSEESSVTSDVSYSRFSQPLLEPADHSTAGDDNSVRTPSIGNSSVLSDGRAPASVDSERRSVDSEVERYMYARSDPPEGPYSRSAKHSRGVPLDGSNTSYQSIPSQNSSYSLAGADSSFADKMPNMTASENCLWYQTAEQGSMSSQARGLNRRGFVPSCVSDHHWGGSLVNMSRARHNVEENCGVWSDRTPIGSASSVDSSVSCTRYPWQRTLPECSASGRDNRSELQRVSEHNGSVSTLSLDVTVRQQRGAFHNDVFANRSKGATLNEIKNRSTVVRHARSYSNPVQMIEHFPSPHARKSQVDARPRAVSSQERVGTPRVHKVDPHFNRLMGRVSSRRSPRPHSVTVIERPASRQSNSTPRQSPYLWDNPLSKETRERRLSSGESYGKPIYLRGSLHRPSSSGDVFSPDSQNVNVGAQGDALSFREVNTQQSRHGLRNINFSTFESKEETQQLTAGLVRPKRRPFDNDDNTKTESKTPSKYNQNRRKNKKSFSSHDIRGGNVLPEEVALKKNSNILLSSPTGDLKQRSGHWDHSSHTGNPQRELYTDNISRNLTVNAKETPEEPEEGVNEELAAHIARLFEQQSLSSAKQEASRLMDPTEDVSEDDENENLDVSRDKSIEEIEQMVRELEQKSEAEVDIPRPEVGVLVEEPELESSETEAHVRPLGVGTQIRKQTVPENQGEARRLDSCENRDSSDSGLGQETPQQDTGKSAGSRVIFIRVSKYCYLCPQLPTCICVKKSQERKILRFISSYF